MPAWRIDPSRLMSLQADYRAKLQKLWADFASPELAAPALSDKRFAAPAWSEQRPFAWNAALYLLNADFMRHMADAVDSDAMTRDRIRFLTQQWVDAM
jgi:polyhydroxyalkanoate synthase